MEIHGRLEVFLARLREAPACASAEDALALICRIIESVEDEFCPIPREDPPPLRFTGRMYAPRADRVEKLRNGVLVASSRQHRIYCQPDGSIHIEHVPSQRTIMNKAGQK